MGTPLFCVNQELQRWTATSILVYIDNMYGLQLKG
jgi:hypothetical protein